MKEIQRIHFKNNDTADISSLIEVALTACQYPSELKIRYSFIFEEVLLKWQKEFDDEKVVDLVRYESGSDFCFEIAIAGEKDDPLLENKSDDLASSFISIMKTGLGQELKYRYKDGKNLVSVTLPKLNPEKKLFERNITDLSIPMIIQLLVLNLSSVLDTVMLSFYSDEALSAASLIAQYTSLFNAFVMAIGTGFTVILSKYWTKRDFETSNRVVSMVFIVQGIIGFLFFAAAEFTPSVIMTIYTSIPEVYEQGIHYLKVIAPYYLCVGFAEVYIGFMRNVKDVVKASRFIIISQLVNCALNAFLIFGLCGLPRLGIVGAGLSTAISGAVLIALTIMEYIHSSLLRLKRVHFVTIPKELWKEFLGFTVPLTAKHVSYFAACNAISAIIGHTNTDAVTAVAVRNTVVNLIRSIDNGVAAMASLVMSPYMTCKKKAKAVLNAKFMISYLVKVAAFMAVLFAATRAIVPFAFGSLSEQTLHYINILWVLTTISIFLACMNNGINNAALLPSGDTTAVLIIDTAVMWGCIVLGMFVALNVLKLPVGVVIAIMTFDELIGFPFKFGRYKSMKWCDKLK